MNTRYPLHCKLMGDAVVSMLEAIEQYCDAYRAQYDSNVGNDSVLGPEIGQALNAAERLLNGELGPHDGGHLWDRIRGIATEYEIEPVEQESDTQA
jgi:hypothetical protein